jgi:NUMOD3 motif
MSTTFIYALCDPDTEMVRYVGKSDIPKTRYFHHLKDKHRTHKVNWINQLKTQGKLPLLKIIEEVNKDLWEQSEKKWVTYYRSLVGDKLTNIVDGGIGPNMTEETRKKISEALKGRPPSLAAIKGSIAYRKGKSLSIEICKKISASFTAEKRKEMSERQKGKKLSDEAKRKISEANKGRKPPLLSAEARERISEAKKGQKHTIATRLKLSEMTSNYFLNPEARKKQAENTRKYFFSNPDARKKKSDSCKNQWADPTKRKKILDARSGLIFSDQHRSNISKSLTEYYAANPEICQKRSELVKKQWEQRKLLSLQKTGD